MRALCTSLLLMLGLISTQAQVTEETISMSQGNQNALVLELYNTDKAHVAKYWKHYMRKYRGKTRKVKGSTEWLSDNSDIPGLGTGNTVDVYAEIEEVGNAVILTTWYDLGGTYLNSYQHHGNYDQAEQMLLRFATYVEREMTLLELADEERRLKELEKELKHLKRENDRYHDEIAMAEQRIEKAKANIVVNEEEQVFRAEEIESQLDTVDQVRQKLKNL